MNLKKTISIFLIFTIIFGSFSFAYGVGSQSDSKSTLEVEKSSYEQGDEVEISGVAYNGDDIQPYASVNIKVYLDDKEKFVQDIITDKNGEFSTVYSLDSAQEIGTYTVQAEISGEETLEEEFTVTEMTDEVTRELTLELDEESYYPGETVTINGKAIINSEAESGIEVSVKVLYQDDVKFEKDLTTDSNGEYETTYKLDSDQSLGSYTVKAEMEEKTVQESFKVEEKSSNEDSDSPSGGGSSSRSSSSSEEAKKETREVKVTGGEIKLLDEKIVLNIPKATFDKEVTLSVEMVDEDDVTLPKDTSNTKFKLSGTIYEFDAEDRSFNNPISLTLKYDKDEVEDSRKLGVYYYNEESKIWEYIGGIIDETNGTITVDLEHFSKYAIMGYEKTFEDISIPWAKEEIEVLASKHIINGVDDDNYAPNSNISRAAFAKLLVKALDLKASDNVVKFNDIEEEKWYTQPVETAASLEIVKGYGDGDEFNPNGEITREAMAVMIVRALKQVDPDGDYTVDSLGFGDSDSISDWAKSEVGIASNKGLVTGVSSTEFAPKENATRAQAAVIIYRVLDLLNRI